MRMRINTSKSDAKVLRQKRVECPLGVKDESLPQVEEFKDFGVPTLSYGPELRVVARKEQASSLEIG